MQRQSSGADPSLDDEGIAIPSAAVALLDGPDELPDGAKSESASTAMVKQ